MLTSQFMLEGIVEAAGITTPRVARAFGSITPRYQIAASATDSLPRAS